MLLLEAGRLLLRFLGHRSETEKEMRLELHRVPSSSVVELGLERSPFSPYPQGRPPYQICCVHFGPAHQPRMKREDFKWKAPGPLIATNFFRFHKLLFRSVCCSAHFLVGDQNGESYF